MVHITTASVSMLIASALALKHSHPIAKRNDVQPVAVPTADDVKTALKEWELDVNTVNAFLDGASANLNDLAQLASDAENAASNFAQEEPNQLMTLINWFNNDPNNPDGAGPEAFNCATNDLASGTTIDNVVLNFQSQVLDAFQSIVDDANAGNSDGVADGLKTVNNYRCCNVLPDLDIIWLDSADSAKLRDFSSDTVAVTAARPQTCNDIDCSGIAGASDCASKDNGPFA
jgi:hypothetical protein